MLCQVCKERRCCIALEGVHAKLGAAWPKRCHLYVMMSPSDESSAPPSVLLILTYRMYASVAKATLNLCRGLGLLSLALTVALSLSLYPIKIPIVLKFAKRERRHPSTVCLFTPSSSSPPWGRAAASKLHPLRFNLTCVFVMTSCVAGFVTMETLNKYF